MVQVCQGCRTTKLVYPRDIQGWSRVCQGYRRKTKSRFWACCTSSGLIPGMSGCIQGRHFHMGYLIDTKTPIFLEDPSWLTVCQRFLAHGTVAHEETHCLLYKLVPVSSRQKWEVDGWILGPATCGRDII